MARSLTLTWASSHYRFGRDDGIRVRVEVSCAVGMSSKIFAYRMLPANAAGSRVGFFSHICSPVDIAEFPEDGPTATSSPEWFRLSYVDLLVRSVAEADELITLVTEDVRRIHKTYEIMDTLQAPTTLQLGTECIPELPSSSLSSSGSASMSVGSLQMQTVLPTSELAIGVGIPWLTFGTGAGSGIDGDTANRSRVELCPGESSQLLLLQGFDLSALPPTAVVVGMEVRLSLRDLLAATPGSSSSSSSNGSYDCPRLTYLAMQHPVYGMGTSADTDACVPGPDWHILEVGSDASLWGFPPIYGAALQNGSFGLCLIIAAGATANASVEIDGAELDVYYRETY